MNAYQEHLQQIHEMIETLKNTGVSEEDIKALWKAALETADNIVKGEPEA